MRLLGDFNGLQVGEPEAITQRRDNRPRQARPVLLKPLRSNQNPVGLCAKFLNIFNPVLTQVGQVTGLIFKGVGTTALSAIRLSRFSCFSLGPQAFRSPQGDTAQAFAPYPDALRDIWASVAQRALQNR
jgi:hypothetical protein